MSDPSTSRCYDCEREVPRRDVLVREVMMHHEEGWGYDMVPVPLCRGCVAKRWGERCGECGEEFLSVDRYNEHYAREHMDPPQGQPMPDGGVDPMQRVADALERQNELLEDRNALLWTLHRMLHRRLGDPHELDNERAGAGEPEVEDGLFTLGYTNLHGSRSGSRPEEADR